MKSTFHKILLGLALPLGLASAVVGQTNSTQEDVRLPKPYIVEVVSPQGDIVDTKRGSSDFLDPFLISKELGVEVYPEDRLQSIPPIEMGIGSQITLYQAPKINIIDGKRKQLRRSWVKSVGELLKEAKIPELGLDDKVNFSLDTEVADKMEIRITRVAKTVVIEPEAISYKTVKKPNPNFEKDYKKVLQKGVAGKKNKFYMVTREDGVEVSRRYQKSEIALEPVEEILEVGTKVVVYGSGKATWYGWPAMEAKNAYYAAHKTLPKGTEVWVVNPANGKGIKVTILDRVAADVLIDLSPAAFKALGSLGAGVINVRVEKYYAE